LLLGVSLAFASLTGKAHARPNSGQTGSDYARLKLVIDRIWRAQGLPLPELKLELIDTEGLRADVFLTGKVWMTTGFVATCETDAQVVAWFCQRLVALRTKTEGVALDRAALATLLAAGYDPRQALILWTRWTDSKKLRNSSRFRDVPITPHRLEILRVQIEKLGYLI
jgi:predicted Zn-dependent protease